MKLLSLKRKKRRRIDTSLYSSKIESQLTEIVFKACFSLSPIFIVTFIAFYNASKGYLPAEEFLLYIILGFVLIGFYSFNWGMTDKYYIASRRCLSYLTFFYIFVSIQLGTFNLEFDYLLPFGLFLIAYVVMAMLLKFRSIAMNFTINLLVAFVVIQAILDQSTEVFTNWAIINPDFRDILFFFYVGLEIYTRIFFKGEIWSTKVPAGFRDNSAMVASAIIDEAVHAAARSGNPSGNAYITEYCATCGSRRPCYDCETVCQTCYFNESMCRCKS